MFEFDHGPLIVMQLHPAFNSEALRNKAQQQGLVLHILRSSASDAEVAVRSADAEPHFAALVARRRDGELLLGPQVLRDNVPELLRSLADALAPDVTRVFVDTTLHNARAAFESRDPDPASHLDMLGVHGPLETPGNGVALGLVDLGASFNHPTLRGKPHNPDACVDDGSGQHALAVLGLAAGNRHGSFVGVAPGVDYLHVETACDANLACTVASRLSQMAQQLRPGSVIVLPLEAAVPQDWTCDPRGPTCDHPGQAGDTKRIPPELVESRTFAIATDYKEALASAQSLHVVVAAAGNSSVDLDCLACPPARSILVGAANFDGVPVKSSNHGAGQVTCFGPAEGLVAPGYYRDYAHKRQGARYTRQMNSTSGAAAAIAGLCAVIQEAAPKLKFGRRLTHDQMKALLGDPRIRRDKFNVQVPDLQKILTYLDS